MGRWDSAVKRASSGDTFASLEEGLNKIRVLMDPVCQNKDFNDGNGPRTIFSWLVWDYRVRGVRILSKGASFLKELDFISETWGDEMPMSCDIVIQKRGSGLATRYKFQAIPVKEQLPPDIAVLIGSIDLNKVLPNHIPIGEFAAGKSPALEDSDREDVMRSHENKPQQDDVVIEDVGDDPINLDEIPF